MWKWEADDPRGVFVIVHGAGEHHGRYNWLIDKWLSQGFHVVMGDLPGHGETTRRRGHIDSFDDYIKSVSDWIEAAEAYGLPIFLLGHSLGGLVVIRSMVEKRLPVQAVLLSSPCTGILHPPARALKAAVRAANSVVPKLRVRIKSSSNNPSATRNEERLQQDAEDPLIVQKVSIRWYNELERAMKAASVTVNDFPNVPLLLMQAGEDKIVDQHTVISWFDRLPIKDRTYKEWDGLYHEIFNEPERDDVFRYACGFVDLHLPQHQDNKGGAPEVGAAHDPI